MQNNQARMVERQQREEMELLSLQSELRQKNSKLRTLQAKYEHLDKNFRYILESHKAIIAQLDTYKQELETEKNKNIQLDNELQIAKMENAKVNDAKLKNDELKKEIELLQNVNLQLKDAFGDDIKKMQATQAKKYETVIHQLEEEIKKWTESSKKQFAENKQLQSKVAIQNKKIIALETSENELKNDIAGKNAKVAKLVKKIEVLELYNKQTEKLAQSQPPPRPTVETKTKGTQTISEQSEKPVMVHKFASAVPEDFESPPKIEKIREEKTYKKNKSKSSRQEETETVVAAPKQSPRLKKKFNPAEINFLVTENKILLQVHELHINNRNFPNHNNVPVFLSIEFFVHETVMTPLIQHKQSGSGVAKSLINFKCNFGVDMTRMLLSYLALESLPILLCTAHGLSSYDVIGRGSLSLEGLFLNEKSVISNESVSLVLSSNDNVEIGSVVVSVAMDVPLAECGVDPLLFLNYSKELQLSKSFSEGM